MKNTTSKIIKNLNVQLEAIDLEESDIITKSQKAVSCIKSSLTQLKAFIKENPFKNS